MYFVYYYVVHKRNDAHIYVPNGEANRGGIFAGAGHNNIILLYYIMYS